MRVHMLAAIALSGFLAISIANAAPTTTENDGSLQGPQLADNGTSMSGTNNMSGSAAMSGSSTMSGANSDNMNGTPGNNMSGTSSNNMSGTSSPSDEGGADTATGDDY